MPALITDKFRVYNAKQFLESFDEASSTQHFFFVGRSKTWATLVEYYSPTGSAYSTGSVTLAPATGTPYTNKTLTVVASLEGAFLVTGLDPLSIAGVKFGDTLTWTGGGATVLKVRPATEDAPLDPQDNLEEKYDYYREIIAAKRIYDNTLGSNTGIAPDGSYVRAVVNRLDYGRNENFTIRTAAYDMWRPNYASSSNFTRQASSGESGVANLEMVVRNPDYEVWLCIDNNNGATPVDPTVSYPRRATVAANADVTTVGYFAGNGIYTDSARYRWKYLFTLNTTEVLRFQSQKFIPLSTFTGVAVTGPEAVAILNGGSGWGAGPFYAPINGDGQQSNTALKIVKFTTSGGVINTARVLTTAESGVTDTEYTFGTVQMVAGNTTVTSKQFKYGIYTDIALTAAATVPASPGALEVIMPPQGGYGADLQEQLNAKRIMCNIRLTFSEGSGDFPITNDFRRIGLLRDPKAYDGSALPASTETIRNTFAVKFSATNGPAVNYVPDEKITQTFTTNGVNYTVTGTVVEWKPTDPEAPAQGGELRYYQDSTVDRFQGQVLAFGNTAAGVRSTLVGATSGAAGTVTSSPASTSFATDATLYPEIQPNSGEIIYVENRRLITRAEDQIEDIKLVIEF